MELHALALTPTYMYMFANICHWLIFHLCVHLILFCRLYCLYCVYFVSVFVSS